MTTLRTCPVCRSTVSSSDSTHCPECGAVLYREFSDAESTAVDDIIKKVKQQITPPDDSGATHGHGSGSADGRDIAEILSDAAFQSILNKNSDGDEASAVEGSRPGPETAAGQSAGADKSYPEQPDTGIDDARAERAAPFRTVLGSFKQSRAADGAGAGQSDDTAPPGDAGADDERPFIERPDPVRPSSFKKGGEPKPRTWWGSTRQILWLLVVLFVCIIFFRIFGPERKKPTIEELFRPENTDIEFLDAIEILEKYYEKQRKQKVGRKNIPSDETAFDGMRVPQPAAGTTEDYAGQASDTAANREPSPSASKGPMP